MQMAVRGRVVAAVVAALLLVACGGRELPDVDLAAAADEATAVVPVDADLVDAGWAEVAAFVTARADEGTPVLVNAFASWCAPCRDELPVLVAAAQGTDDVVVLGVAHQDRREDAAAMVADFDLPYATVFDRTGEFVFAVEGTGMPVTVLFDADGELVRHHVGGLTADDLADWLEDVA